MKPHKPEAFLFLNMLFFNIENKKLLKLGIEINSTRIMKPHKYIETEKIDKMKSKM